MTGIGFQTFQAALFRPPACNPENILIARQRPAGRSGIGCLTIIDIGDWADGPCLKLPMLQPREML